MSVNQLPDAQDGLLPFRIDRPEIDWAHDGGEVTLFPVAGQPAGRWITIDSDHAISLGESL